jgi:hypothetical protein
MGNQHPLAPLIRPTMKSANCRVVWAAGPDCTPPPRGSTAPVACQDCVGEHCLCQDCSSDSRPSALLSCCAQQIERHLWARNGSSTDGMALNYCSGLLCHSFRDLDLTLVQMSAAGMSIGLGARRVFALLICRFSMDGYLCDPERRTQGTQWWIWIGQRWMGESSSTTKPGSCSCLVGILLCYHVRD